MSEQFAQFVDPMERDERGDGDQAAVTLGQPRAFPDVAKEYLVGQFHQPGGRSFQYLIEISAPCTRSKTCPRLQFLGIAIALDGNLSDGTFNLL